MTGPDAWWRPATLAEYDGAPAEQRAEYARLFPTLVEALRARAAREVIPPAPTTAAEFRAASYETRARLHQEDVGTYERLRAEAQTLPPVRR